MSTMLYDVVYASKKKYGGKWHLSYLPGASPNHLTLCGHRPRVDQEEVIKTRKDLDALMEQTKGRMCSLCARSAPWPPTTAAS